MHGKGLERTVVVIASAWLLHCAPAGPSWRHQQGVGIRLGVDHVAEAASVQLAFENAGYVLVERRQGHRYVALQFAGDAGLGQAVRVVTDRGISLALDGRASSPLHGSVTFELMRDAGSHTAGAAAGNVAAPELVMVLERHGVDGPSCVRPYEVLESGRVEAVPDDDDSQATESDNMARCEEGW